MASQGRGTSGLHAAERAAPTGRARAAHPGMMAALLTTGFTFAYVDRHLLSLLVAPIKASMGLSDTQMGLLLGASFSLFYVLASLPLAWLADRGNRPRIIAACVAIWSGMTMVCGLTSSFFQLLVARVGVAVAEAGLPPAALTLMADQLDRKQLARATSFFMLAPFLGGGLVLIIGGSLYGSLSGWEMPVLPGFGRLQPWQALFVIIGAPGFVLALLIVGLLKEPRQVAPERAPMSVRPLVQMYRSDWRFFVVYTVAIALAVMLLNAHIAWLPTALMRAYDIDESFMGLTFGPVYLIAGAAGTLAAGMIISRAADTAMMMRTLRFMRICAFALILPAIVAPLAPNLIANLALLAVTVFLTSAIVSMSSIPFQVAAPHALRAQAIATTTLVASLVGTGIGPLLVGVLSDALAGIEQSLPAALAVIAAMTVPAVAILMSAVIRHVQRTRPERV